MNTPNVFTSILLIFFINFILLIKAIHYFMVRKKRGKRELELLEENNRINRGLLIVGIIGVVIAALVFILPYINI